MNLTVPVLVMVIFCPGVYGSPRVLLGVTRPLVSKRIKAFGVETVKRMVVSFS